MAFTSSTQTCGLPRSRKRTLPNPDVVKTIQSERVWDYVQRFSDWRDYEHRAKAFVDGRFVPVPPNQETVNTLFEANVHSEDEMKV